MQAHVPVLLKETLALLSPRPGENALDVTLGLGGHSEEILKAIGSTGRLIALDADTTNSAVAEKRLSLFRSQLKIIHANFRELPDCLPENERQFALILADLGLSSPHIDDPSRGFMFRQESPLDMRFDQSKGMTAAMLIASTDPQTLLSIFWEYGELPAARRLVDALVARRAENPVRMSSDLVAVANDVYGYKAPKILPQIFQALRIAVNQEIAALESLLNAIPELLSPGGRCVIISYHSLEDSLVKTAFRALTTDEKDPMTGAVSTQSPFTLLTKKSVTATEEELRVNPRARSARLRAITKR